MVLILLFLLNIIFVGAIWHMDIHHNLDKLGETKTRGILQTSPEKAYRYSYYLLILTLLLIDILFVISFTR